MCRTEMHMDQPFKREPRIKHSIALRRDQLANLRELASEERHGNVSLIVQRAIDRELDRVRTEATESRDPEMAVA